jgi:hypothetical protein
MTTKIKYEPRSIVIALESHITPESETIRAGDRVRADHPAVLRNPQLFHVDGLTTAQIQALHSERLDIDTLLARKGQ